MGYLPGFEDDVFISYAHNDDDRYGPEDHGWVAQLHIDLAERIKTYLNASPHLWRDCEIDGNDDFAQKIANRLTRTATLLSVISDNFLNRPWCRREVEEFCRNAGQSIQVGEKRRIFKAERRPIAGDNLPRQLDGTGMYRFYVANPDHPSVVRELRPSLGTETWRLYFEQLDSLARDIATTLRMMKTDGKDAPIATSSMGTVYLAETTFDEEFARVSIRKDLQDRGITVLPQGDLPRRGPQFERQVRDDLGQSNLSLHIFGSEYGFVPEGRQRPHTWLQHDLSLERAKEPDFRRIVWLPASVDTADDRQRQYLDYLRSDAAVQLGAEILDGKLEDVKTEVLRTLDEVRRTRAERIRPKPADMTSPGTRAESARTSDEPLTIYVVCDTQDLQSHSFLALQDCLLNRGYEPLKCSPVDSVDEARRMHEDYLQICDACLIYYGATSEFWLNAKLTDLLKCRSKRQTPFLAKAVYLAPPVTDAKRAFRTNQAKVIQAWSEFSPEQLSLFFESLARV